MTYCIANKLQVKNLESRILHRLSLENKMQSQINWRKNKEVVEKELCAYNNLEKKLRNLALKTRHKENIALGPLAHMPGTLRHTNELTVCSFVPQKKYNSFFYLLLIVDEVYLGAGIWAERSTHQACSIIERRKRNIENRLEEYNRKEKQQKLPTKPRERRVHFETNLAKSEEEKLADVDISCERGSAEWWDKVVALEETWEAKQVEVNPLPRGNKNNTPLETKQQIDFLPQRKVFQDWESGELTVYRNLFCFFSFL